MEQGPPKRTGSKAPNLTGGGSEEAKKTKKAPRNPSGWQVTQEFQLHLRESPSCDIRQESKVPKLTSGGSEEVPNKFKGIFETLSGHQFTLQLSRATKRKKQTRNNKKQRIVYCKASVSMLVRGSTSQPANMVQAEFKEDGPACSRPG